MSKWKCDICKKEFDNFHAQGFDNKIYCPLCFFKEENRRLKEKINKSYEMVQQLKLHYQQSPTMIPSVKIEKLEDLLKGEEND